MKPLKKLLFLAVALTAFQSAGAAEEKPFKLEAGFTSLFDGKSFDGWKVSEKPETFVIEDGTIVAKGTRAHCFYVGSYKNATFKNFELRADVMTKPGSNGGIFISTAFQDTGWPEKGYEIQVNNSHTDWKRSGSLYNTVDVKEGFEDDKWMAYDIKVEGGKISITINGKEILKDYTPEEGKSKLLPDGGTIALQAHDPKSVVFYKNIRIKSLD